MKSIFYLTIALLFCMVMPVQAQEQNTQSTPSSLVGRKYLEDQLYLSLSYNILISTPKQMNTYSFSNAFSFGYIRDIPLNKRRNIGLGVGLGLSFGAYYSNLGIAQASDGSWSTELMDKEDYRNNRLTTQQLDIPIQLRFRGSTEEKFKFWRVYAGVTPSWVFKNLSTINNGDQKVRYYNSPFVSDWIWYANILVGYGKFNIKLDYSLNSVFKGDSSIQDLGSTRTVNVGLLVYII